jgi:hypothetical protein
VSPAFQAVREALDRRRIALPLSGPDWTDMPRLDPAKMDLAAYLGASDIHSLKQPGFKLAPEDRIAVSSSQPEFKHTVLPRSLVVFSTCDLAPEAPGAIGERG